MRGENGAYIDRIQLYNYGLQLKPARAEEVIRDYLSYLNFSTRECHPQHFQHVHSNLVVIDVNAALNIAYVVTMSL
jgi:hypothetical protein